MQIRKLAVSGLAASKHLLATYPEVASYYLFRYPSLLRLCIREE
jgi:hypothetical protein